MFSIFISLSLISLSFSQLRFKFTKKPSKYPEQNLIIVPIQIGTPSQIVPLSLEFFSNTIWVIDDECGDTVLSKQIPFTPRLSSTYKVKPNEFSKDFLYTFNTGNHLVKAKQVVDTVNSLPQIDFFVARRFTGLEASSGVLGLDSNNVNFSSLAFKGFISQLRDRGVVNKEIFYIKYDDDIKGELVIGEDPNEKKSKIKYYRKEIENHQWSVKMNSVDYGNNAIEGDVIANFKIELGVMIGNEFYYNTIKKNFFNNLISRKKCVEYQIKNTEYSTFQCKDIYKNFPPLSFEFDKELIITFTYEELFSYDTNDEKMFKVFFSKGKKEEWTLGEPFFKKNILVFDSKNQTIGIMLLPSSFIDTVLKYKYYIILPVILISIFLVIVLHYSKRKQVNQKKTKKANGLIPIAEKNTFCTENEEELKEII